MPNPLLRRHVLQGLAATGIGSLTFQRALAVMAQEDGSVTDEMIKQAEWISGVELSEEDRKSTARGVERYRRQFKALRAIELDNSVAPAFAFRTAHIDHPQHSNENINWTELSSVDRPEDHDDLAFMPVSELSQLIRTREMSSVELTKLYLDRLTKYDPLLLCTITKTEETALKQAERADREISSGRYRGPLHGIPWGAKDLIAYPGYPTTWGAEPFREQVIDNTATVARKLGDAGAVLVAKLTLGALAQGDKWFGGMTRNPWNPQQGSSGSSAGSSSATVAGLVGFALGSETLGSIVSPCRRCGATGLRPTFGRVSRAGCMALAWTMDKIGPIGRSVEDCAIIFNSIRGTDGVDLSVVDQPFHWPVKRDLRSYRVGYTEKRRSVSERSELQVLKDLGVQLVPIKLPTQIPAWALTQILNAEAATAFDSLTREGITEGLNSWPATFRQGQYVPAVEYIRANRVRSQLMLEMKEVMRGVDVYVGGDDLLITNMTGHPTVVMPDSIRDNEDGTSSPRGITFTGQLFGEAELLAVAQAYQQATGVHLRRPPLASFLQQHIEKEKAASEKEKPAADPNADKAKS